MIKTFVKKPVQVQAVQWTGDNYEEIVDFVGCGHPPLVPNSSMPEEIIIRTLEGDYYAHVGDWIIRGVNGEFYPCKPDIFKQVYEELR